MTDDDRNKWWTLVAVCVATFMLLLDITIVNVALPDIQQRPRLELLSDLQWVVDAYALTLAALLLTAGSLADLLRAGAGSSSIGLRLFTLRLAAVRARRHADVLNLVARAAGRRRRGDVRDVAGAAGRRRSSGRERGTAFGIWGATTGAAVAVGPLVGGVLTERVGWQSIFFVNLPIGIAAIVVDARARCASRSDPSAPAIDWPGAGDLLRRRCSCSSSRSMRGNAEGWRSAPIVGLLLGAAVLLVAFVVVERRREQPMLDLDAVPQARVRRRLDRGLRAVGVDVRDVPVPHALHPERARLLAAARPALRFLPMTLLSFIAAPIAGQARRARRRCAWLLGVGLALVGVGLLLMRGIDADSSWTDLLRRLPRRRRGHRADEPGARHDRGRRRRAAAQPAWPPASTTPSARSGSPPASPGWAPLLEHLMTSKLGSRIPGAGAGHRQPAPGAARHAARIPDAYTDSLDTLLLVGALSCITGAVLAFVLVRQRDFVASRPPEAAESFPPSA